VFSYLNQFWCDYVNTWLFIFLPAFLTFKQEVLGRTNRLLFLIRHGPHWNRRVQQFLYCCVCIRSVTFLPSRCLATIGGYTDTHTDSNVISYACCIFSLVSYFEKYGRLMRLRCCLCLCVCVRSCVCVCVCLCIPPIVARHRPGSVKIPLSLLGNGSVETLPR
jgi:hypothetical protein